MVGSGHYDQGVTRRNRWFSAGRGPGDPWFRIGTLDVNTTMLVVLLSVAAFVVFAVEPYDKPVMYALALDPQSVLHGQVWRLLTWPLSYPSLGLFDVVAVFFFWYFGNDLETNDLSRDRMLRFVVGVVVVLGLLSVVLSVLLPISGFLTGLGSAEIMVLLAWIAEHPERRFLFNVPAWLFGVIIVGIQVLQFVGYREWSLLLNLLLGIVLCALVARSVGLLSEYSWLPQLRRPIGRQRAARPRRQRKGSVDTVVAGPWDRPVSSDQARMDRLLDKIHASGSDSLSDAERRELLELRDRLRRG